MATPRTATTAWKKLRSTIIRDARANGMEHCPQCRVPLTWAGPRTPQSAEVDHITPVSQGGTDHPSNLRILCRRCNQQRGDGTRGRRNPAPPRHQAAWLHTSRPW